MKHSFLLFSAIITAAFFLAGCQTQPAQEEPTEQVPGAVEESTDSGTVIPEESTDEMDSNLENALFELDLVE